MKRSHGVNVQNLIQKIENHPQRQALQSDLQQHRQFNLFSKESKDMIREVHLEENYRRTIHMSIAEKSGRPERDSDLRCQSGQSAKNSVIISG